MKIKERPESEFRFVEEASDAMLLAVFRLGNTAVERALDAADCDCVMWHNCEHGDRHAVELWLSRFRKMQLSNDKAVLRVLAAHPLDIWSVVDRLPPA